MAEGDNFVQVGFTTHQSGAIGDWAYSRQMSVGDRVYIVAVLLDGRVDIVNKADPGDNFQVSIVELIQALRGD